MAKPTGPGRKPGQTDEAPPAPPAKADVQPNQPPPAPAAAPIRQPPAPPPPKPDAPAPPYDASTDQPPAPGIPRAPQQPTNRDAVVTLGQPLLRQRAGSLFIDDPLLWEFRGPRAIQTIDRMLLDPVISGTLERTSLMLRGADWHIEAGDDRPISKEWAERVQADVNNLETGWASTVAQSADMLGWGFALFETLFRSESDGIHWADFSPRDQRTVRSWDIEHHTGKVLGVLQRIETMPQLPQTIPGWKLLHFRTHPASGRPEGRALIRNAFVAWTDKQEIRRITKLGLRRDFTGIPKMQVPLQSLTPGATPEEKAAVAQAESLVQDVERDKREGIVVPSETDPRTNQPSGWKLDLMQSPGRRQLDIEAIYMVFNREILIALLAEFILLGHDLSGSRSLGDSKMGFFMKAGSAWLDNIAEVMEKKATPVLQALNPKYAKAARPKWKHGDINAIDLAELSQFITAAVGSGGIVPDPELDSWLREQIGAPVAAENLEL